MDQSSLASSITSNETVPKKTKLSTGILWKSVVVLLVVVIAVCEAQTFQYSRGWTNGKRSRGMENRYPSGPGPAQPFDIDVGVVEVPIDDVPVPLRINLSPQLRTRSTDYNQESRKGSDSQISHLGWNFNGAGARKQLK